MKNLLFCLCLLLFVTCQRPPNNAELDITGETIEYSFEPSTSNLIYQVQFTSEIGTVVTERMQAGQVFYKKINTNQSMGFKNADLVVQNLDSQKPLTGKVILKRNGRNKTSEIITLAGQANYKFTDYVYR